MIIAMNSDATEEQIEEVCASIRRYGYKPHLIRGEERVVIGAVGDAKAAYTAYMPDFVATGWGFVSWKL